MRRRPRDHPLGGRLVDLATRLSPYCNRLAAYLAMAVPNEHRIDVGTYQRRVELLCEEAMLRLGIDEDGVFTPYLVSSLPERPLLMFEDAVRFMHRPVYTKTTYFKERHFVADRVGGYPPLLKFERLMVREFRKLGIPIYARTFMRSAVEQDGAFVRGEKSVASADAPHCHGFAVDLVPCHIGPDLPGPCWQVLHLFAQELATARDLPLVIPSGDRPWHYEVEGWRDLLASGWDVEPDGDLWNTSRLGSRDERDELLRYYSGEASRFGPALRPERDGGDDDVA